MVRIKSVDKDPSKVLVPLTLRNIFGGWKYVWEDIVQYGFTEGTVSSRCIA